MSQRWFFPYTEEEARERLKITQGYWMMIFSKENYNSYQLLKCKKKKEKKYISNLDIVFSNNRYVAYDKEEKKDSDEFGEEEKIIKSKSIPKLIKKIQKNNFFDADLSDKKIYFGF